MQAAKKVAVNTSVQYVQLILNVLIGLLSVRIILKSLGEVDYGVYNLLGGVITLISFIRNSLTQTSIRFISVSMGTGDLEQVRHTFNACFSLHLVIGLALAVLLEIVGLFLFDGFLNIPEDRIFAAKIVYHCMAFTLFLNVAVTPFTGVLAAHEQFVFTSAVGILDSVCKLLIALYVAVVGHDKLIVYGILMAGIVAMNVCMYIGMVLIRYRDNVQFNRFDINEMKSVTGFAGWTLLDVLGSVLNRQGYAVMLNLFFGPVTNAVYALAGQVDGHIYSISSSVVDTIKPQIMKSQGAGDTSRVFRLSFTAGKFGFSMMSLVAIPLLIMMPEVLDLWLSDVPEGTVLFSRIMVAACMMEQMTRGLVHANQAIGRIKWFSIIVSSIRVMALPVSIIFLILGAKPYVTIIIYFIFETLGSFSRVLVMSHITELKVGDFMKSVLLNLIPPFALSCISGYLLFRFVSGIWGMLAVTLVCAAVFASVLYYFGLTKEERNSINSIVAPVIAKLFHK